MTVKDPGHLYSLQGNKTTTENESLKFYKDPVINGTGYEGTTNQEVLRVLIDRVMFLDKQMPNDLNLKIIKHLRYALVYHEMRHLERLVDRDEPIEIIEGEPTHFIEFPKD